MLKFLNSRQQIQIKIKDKQKHSIKSESYDKTWRFN